MEWEVVTHEPDELTERLAVDGGYLYRTVREVARGIGQTPLVGAALVFVGAVVPVRPWHAADAQMAATLEGVSGAEHFLPETQATESV